MHVTPLPSPNFESRGGQKVDMLVLHYTGMPTAQAAKERLTDPTPGKRVSAHYLVEEDGTVYSMVPEDQAAWHAGVSQWRGVGNINQRSIGIEMVNPGHEYGLRPFPPAQMEAVAALSVDIVARHAIPAWHVVAHSDIAPTRKEDPGELFDWAILAARGVGVVPVSTPAEDSGVVGWVKRLFGMADSPLKFGDSGPKVLDMQTKLAQFGYGIDVCSTFGKDTEACVRAFQRHFRQEKVDGVWDAECNNRLNDLLKRVPAVNVNIPDGRTAAGPLAVGSR